ncbi:MAG: hypothetical protein H8E75_06015 [Puniceicoccaceae bacterium]|nr:hypothetical protein [Puniceicoccaceae bacterium]
MKVFTLTLFAIFGLLSARGLAAQGTESFFAEAGLRAGVDAERGINLVSYELFGEIDMDWSWNLSDSLRLNLNIETAIGGLYGESEHAVYGRMAPIAKLHLGDSPVTIVLSSGPSFYSKDTYDDYDIGGHFEFTTSDRSDHRHPRDDRLLHRFFAIFNGRPLSALIFNHSLRWRHRATVSLIKQ